MIVNQFFLQIKFQLSEQKDFIQQYDNSIFIVYCLNEIELKIGNYNDYGLKIINILILSKIFNSFINLN